MHEHVNLLKVIVRLPRRYYRIAKNTFKNLRSHSTSGITEEVEKVSQHSYYAHLLKQRSESNFFKTIQENRTGEIEPVFADFQKEITFTDWNGIKMYCLKNVENSTFELKFRFNAGELNDLRLPIATMYFDYLGTAQFTAAQFKEEFYRIACNLSFYSSDDYSQITLSGLSENYEKTLSLTMDLLNGAMTDETALLENLINDILNSEKARATQFCLNGVSFLWIWTGTLLSFFYGGPILNSLRNRINQVINTVNDMNRRFCITDGIVEELKQTWQNIIKSPRHLCNLLRSVNSRSKRLRKTASFSPPTKPNKHD